MMAGIRGKNTKPEIQIRQRLHRLGYRFRLHDKRLPGVPDLVLRKHNAVIFVHGCFWHGHSCHLFKMPGSRTPFWLDKIAGNRRRDESNLKSLQELGWRTCVVWECALRGRHRLPTEQLETRLSQWLLAKEPSCSLAGAEMNL
jgi:DNA mismatch endonuclease (patch repair protein)